MKKIVEKEWSALSPIWNKLYNNNNNATPYQSYEYLTFTGKGKAQREDLFRLIGVKELNLVLIKNDEIIAIAPLLIKRQHKKNMVFFRGHFTTAHQLDFIYKDWKYEDLKFLMDGIRRLLGDVSFFLDRVSEKTVTCKYLNSYFSSEYIERRECYAIPIPDNYDEWYNNLRKSVRRNMTTMKNRIKRDQIKWSLDFFCRRVVDHRTCKEMMKIYANRFMVKNNFQFGPLSKPVNWILMMFLLRDKMTKWLNIAENNFHAVVYMNDEIAAMSSGLICKDKRIIGSRLAINTKYAKYSPGGLLLSSQIKYIIEQNESGKLNIDQLDLSEGGDGGMSYKQAYGGLVHYVYTFMD